jgi:hypothetical protein
MNPSRDRIAQGRFFLRKAEEAGFSDRDAFRYFLEAAIVAARSVTHLLQKQYQGVCGFDEWYEEKQAVLKSDPLARFLLEKRNFILKEGVAQIRKHIQVEIHQTISVTSSFKVEIIRGSWKSRLRHLIKDLVYPLREKIVGIKEKRRRRRQARHDNQVQTTEAYYFTEPEWSSMPATELLKEQFDTLESIMKEATQKFGEPFFNPSGS